MKVILYNNQRSTLTHSVEKKSFQTVSQWKKNLKEQFLKFNQQTSSKEQSKLMLVIQYEIFLGAGGHFGGKNEDDEDDGGVED